MKAILLLALTSSLLTLTSCSPKVKIELWAKQHQDAALALRIWSATNADAAKTLLDLDCHSRKEFKKKITDALTTAPAQQPNQLNYYINQAAKLLNRKNPENPDEGFADWCRQYPQAAKKLRCHARALCKTGMEVLKSGQFKVN